MHVTKAYEILFLASAKTGDTGLWQQEGENRHLEINCNENRSFSVETNLFIVNTDRVLVNEKRV